MREDTESTQKCVCACVLEEVIESFLEGQCHAESLRSMVKEGKGHSRPRNKEVRNSMMSLGTYK